MPRSYPIASLLLLASLLTNASAAFLPVSTRRSVGWGVCDQCNSPRNRLAEGDSDGGALHHFQLTVGKSAPKITLVASSKASDHEKTSKPIKLIIAGAPASGKGTQCEKIKEKYGVVHLSTGDMLRAAVAAGTEVGKLAKEFMDSGKLVPDDVMIGVVKDRLESSDCKSQGWLLDGFPRTPAQAAALADAGVSADCFLFLNVPDEILVERVVGRRSDPVTGKIYHMKFSPPEDEEVLARLEQRSDDTEEKVKVRLEQFHANVEAVKGSYTDISVDIDGSLPPAEVAAAVDAAIASKVGA